MALRTTVRKTVFWAHLVTGVCAGLVVLMMSATGVLLTYERQIEAWIDSRETLSCSSGCERLSADDLYAAAASATGSDDPSVTLYRDPDRPASARAGRGAGVLLDPYDGTVLREGPSAAAGFFSLVMGIHRWFALDGDARDTGRAVTGYSNLLFLFLLASGIYLWLPRVWNRAMLKTRILFNPRAKTPKARDFNWHHVFAFWAALPLLLIITTATVFYFDWSNELVYAAFGEEPPERRSGGSSATEVSIERRPVEALLRTAVAGAEENGAADWQSVSLRIAANDRTASFSFDRSIGGQPAKVIGIDLNSVTGTVIGVQRFADRTPGQRARSTIRFLHTGEVLGLAGQTAAGLASLAACFLVWTGLALAWRRLVQPLVRRRIGQPSPASDYSRS